MEAGQANAHETTVVLSCQEEAKLRLQPTSSISIIPVLILFFNLNLYFPRVFFA
jgi:hypothetical protein